MDNECYCKDCLTDENSPTDRRSGDDRRVDTDTSDFYEDYNGEDISLSNIKYINHRAQGERKQ